MSPAFIIIKIDKTLQHKVALLREPLESEFKEIGVEALEAREIRVSCGATVCWGYEEK